METKTEWFVWHPAMEPLTQEQVRQYIAYRHSCGLTNVKIADEIGMSSKRVSEIDLGNPKQTGRAQLRVISKLLSAMWPEGIPLASVVKTSKDSTEGDTTKAFGPSTPTSVITVTDTDGSKVDVVPRAQFDEVWEALGVATRAVEELQYYKSQYTEQQAVIAELRRQVSSLRNANEQVHARLRLVHGAMRNFARLLDGARLHRDAADWVPVTYYNVPTDEMSEEDDADEVDKDAADELWS